MRQKRAKIYRKLLHKYVLHFGFREPYQVLIDSAFAQSLSKQKIDEPLKRVADVIQAKAKLMVTQCSMVALYKQEKEGEYQKRAVQMAKTWERRMCNHKDAIDECDCLASVIGPTNKHRYVLASDQPRLRRKLRVGVPGVPLIHCNQTGVLVMEPMSDLTARKMLQVEQAKLALAHKEGSANAAAAAAAAAAALVSSGDSPLADDTPGARSVNTPSLGAIAQPAQAQAKKRKGPKQPNPLSMRKPKQKAAPQQPKSQAEVVGVKRKRESADGPESSAKDSAAFGKSKRRKRGKGDAQGAQTE
ncbi:hypothetical protein K437DRAFT_237454 [Tilletiaria anomala UBC 951]|uniref:U three protein 23 n=1 Tax=Tilletiaria anomala (strain ATCC 24038 / CBS 436.72 / UBC 951) TaxID=1037660 RepID=A0A066VWS5_TILAU|nr:uncharacterized protein K437DRAFT_237454 [Tilletiaria anomala UBC 951]KDN42995.1 hypothetical protein K437DRAFT_237454 [Tilletiaria anomala UBC 951]